MAVLPNNSNAYHQAQPRVSGTTLTQVFMGFFLEPLFLLRKTNTNVSTESNTQ